MEKLIRDIPQALSNSHTCLCLDDDSISYQHKDVTEIGNVLNKEFVNLCECFVDKNLSIHFGEDKTKSVFFSRARNLLELNITNDNIRIKQFYVVNLLLPPTTT